MSDTKRISIVNREINYKYDIIEKMECGISLKGTEVKSIRDNGCNLKDSFAMIKNNNLIGEIEKYANR